ncbi:hypothetical protein D3C73_1274180 [compost metagenome]
MLVGLLPVMQSGKTEPEQSRCEFHILQLILEHPVLQHDSSCPAKLRGPVRCNLIAGIQGNQVGQVPVLRLGFRIILQPFLQLPSLADLKRRQLEYRFLQLPLQLFVPLQQLR